MTDALPLRPVEAADAERVRAVYERAMRDADAYLPGADHADLDAPTTAYADGAFLVGEVDGEVVAVGGVRPVAADAPTTDGTAFETERVAVHPAFQGEGDGRAVVRALEDAARDRGADRVVLETGAEQRAAQALYESQGYERVERLSYAGGEVVGLRYAKRVSVPHD
ncbi:GNAT family N-acetyltransferase [Haloglomus litoreum]|uniref:GNAT family N-acetyltransferase n=1 Tax=Haloglomus litoreum TaxID=3034026 RepID=UPI0023E7A41C|nr:GNAT family N-acetyltransferase [Haloglomus sp. DT116]